MTELFSFLHEVLGVIERHQDLAFRSFVVTSFLPIPIVLVISLLRADRANDTIFHLVHFVTSDTGRGSPFALGYTTMVIVCGWGVWALVALDKLTEWYMTLVIGGFVVGALGGRAAQVMSRMKGANEPEANAGDAAFAPPESPDPNNPH